MTRNNKLLRGWREVKLGDICGVFNGKTPSEAEKRESGIPILKIRDVDENGKFRGKFESFVDLDFYKKYSEKIIKHGDTLILNAAHNAAYVGTKTLFVENLPDNTIATGEWLIVRANPKLMDAKFKHFVMTSPFVKNQIKEIVKGIHLYPKDVRLINIFLPPITIQNQIVSILEEVEVLKQKRGESDKLTKEYLQSVFYEMFGDPERNNKNWPKFLLKDVAEVVRESVTPENIQNDEKYIGLEDIGSESGKIIKINNISKGELKSNKFVFDSNFVLYGKLRPYLNKIALPNFKGICSTDVLPIRPLKNKSNRYYLAFLLRNKYYIQLATDRSVGANLPRLSPKSLEYFEIQLPPIELQQKFALIVEEVEKLKEKQKQSKEELNVMFDSLMKKAFNGELIK
jgi:type I restriction enzyme, S subunit